MHVFHGHHQGLIQGFCQGWEIKDSVLRACYTSSNNFSACHQLYLWGLPFSPYVKIPGWGGGGGGDFPPLCQSLVISIA
jgi:hypothetical protein